MFPIVQISTVTNGLLIYSFYEQNSVNTVTIFNRWGDVIKSIENYDNQSNVWDGTNTNDQPMPSGTYFFTIEVPSEQIRCSNWVQIVKEN